MPDGTDSEDDGTVAVSEFVVYQRVTSGPLRCADDAADAPGRLFATSEASLASQGVMPAASSYGAIGAAQVDASQVFLRLSDIDMSDAASLPAFFDRCGGSLEGDPTSSGTAGVQSHEASLLLQLKQAVAEFGFGVRSPLGQRWYRELSRDRELAGEYEKVLGQRAQRAFRVEWAKRTLAILQESKVQSTSSTMLEKEHGSYLPFAVIVKKEGGMKCRSAVEAAVRYCRKCTLLGGRWRLYNHFTERWDFLYIRREYSSIFQKEWVLFLEQSSGRLSDDVVSTGGDAKNESQAAFREGSAVDAKTRRNRMVGGRRNSGQPLAKVAPLSAAGQGTKRQRLNVESAETLALQLRSRYIEVRQVALDIIGGEQTRETEGTDRHEDQIPDIQTSLDELESAASSEFFQRLVRNDCAYRELSGNVASVVRLTRQCDEKVGARLSALEACVERWKSLQAGIY